MRRTGAVVVGTVLSVGVLAGPAEADGTPAPAGGGTAVAASRVDWSQYRADGAHSGDVAAQPGLDPTSVARRGLRLVASVPFSYGAGAAPSAGALQGFVFGADGVQAVGLVAGATRWATSRIDAANLQGAVSRGVVVVPVEMPGHPFVGLDAVTGATRWELSAQGPASSAPAVNAAGDTAYAVIGNDLQSFAVTTGVAGWSVPLPGYPGFQVPTVTAGRVFLTTRIEDCSGEVCSYGQQLTAFAATDGRQLWSVPEPAVSPVDLETPSVVASGDTVYAVGLDGSLGAYAAATGALRWSVPVGASTVSAPALAGSGSTILLGDDTGDLLAVAAVDGHLLWRTTLSTSRIYSPAVAGGVAWVTDGLNALVAVDASTGVPLWTRTNDPSSVVLDPVVADDRLLVADQGLNELQIYAPA